MVHMLSNVQRGMWDCSYWTEHSICVGIKLNIGAKKCDLFGGWYPLDRAWYVCQCLNSGGGWQPQYRRKCVTVIKDLTCRWGERCHWLNKVGQGILHSKRGVEWGMGAIGYNLVSVPAIK
jgi:hypothetical protein